MKYVMELIQNDIRYGKISFPDICRRMAAKTEEPYRSIFEKLEERLEEKTGESFLALWCECAELIRQISCLKRTDVECFMQFPTKTGYQNSGMQERDMEMKITELQTSIDNLQKSIDRNAKVYLCVSVLGGLLCCLLFW